MNEDNNTVPPIPPIPPIGSGVPDMKSFMDYLAKTEDKTAMYVLMQLLNKENIEFITEYPSVVYTKAMVKYLTWRKSIKEVLNLTDEEEDEIVKEMTDQFMLKMTSHKRRRAQEIVMPLKHDPQQQTIYMENVKKRKWFGLG